MRQLIFGFFIMLSLSLFSQQILEVRCNSSQRYLPLTNSEYSTIVVDAMYLFYDLESSTRIAYLGTEDDSVVEWKNLNGDMLLSGSKELSPDIDEVYELWVANRKVISFWVVDYKNYYPLNSVLSVVEADDKCDNVQLLASPQIGNIVYNRYGINARLPHLTLSYTNIAWSNDAWTEKQEVKIDGISGFETMAIEAPLCDTKYHVFDRFADKFQSPLVIDTISTTTYNAVKVACYPKGTIIERDGLNEKDRKKDGDVLEGSAPLVIDFKSNANEPTASYYQWYIINNNDASDVIRYTDKDFKFTFQKSGSYKVVLNVSSDNEVCSFSDSIEIKTLESSLEVPNVFTPNGDGINDEFRVAYKSLATYKCLIYNRWGHKIYESTDPTKGWDGLIGGKEAPSAPYFYLIEAVGTDGYKYKLKGDINLIRGKSKTN